MAVIQNPITTLDVIIATYNRSALLSKALRSLLAARRPEGLSISVTVVDNNSKDNTRAVVEEIANSGTPFPVHYIVESAQGRSSALNAGIRSTRGDLIGMIDDDEEVDSAWFEALHDVLRRPGVDFIGGPCLPNWDGSSKPKWVEEKCCVLGWMDYGQRELQYGTDECIGIVMGGNAVYRREVFNKVGLYNTAVGRTAKGLQSCEDSEIFERIIGSGARGLYIPNLVIYHYVPKERLKKNYHRRWYFGHGVSEGVMARHSGADAVEVFGVPRWRLRSAIEGLSAALGGQLGFRLPADGFNGESRLWNLFGFIYGRHFHQVRTLEPVRELQPTN